MGTTAANGYMDMGVGNRYDMRVRYEGAMDMWVDNGFVGFSVAVACP